MLTADRLASMLLGRVTTWADGSAVALVLVDDRDADAELLRIAGRPRERLLRGWKRPVFSGVGVMPLEAASTPAALELVARARSGGVDDPGPSGPTVAGAAGCGQSCALGTGVAEGIFDPNAQPLVEPCVVIWFLLIAYDYHIH